MKHFWITEEQTPIELLGNIENQQKQLIVIDVRKKNNHGTLGKHLSLQMPKSNGRQDLIIKNNILLSIENFRDKPENKRKDGLMLNVK